MSRMNTLFQTVQEMSLNGKELNEIAELLGVSRSLIENIYFPDDNNYYYNNLCQYTENYTENRIFYN